MTKGIYALACCMQSQIAHQELSAANLANAATPGFRRLLAASLSFPRRPAASPDAPYPLPAGRTVSPATLDLSEGPLEQTGRPLDLAIVGEGFFAIQTPSGTLYTRNGRFLRSPDGRLITTSGYPVLGQRGPITLPDGPVSVAEDGSVFVAGKLIDRLRLRTFPPARLAPAAPGLLQARGPGQPANCRIVQGAIEHSNVQPARELGRMLSSLRLYEAAVQALRAQDQSLHTLFSAVA